MRTAQALNCQNYSAIRSQFPPITRSSSAYLATAAYALSSSVRILAASLARSLSRSVATAGAPLAADCSRSRPITWLALLAIMTLLLGGCASNPQPVERLPLPPSAQVSALGTRTECRPAEAENH